MVESGQKLAGIFAFEAPEQYTHRLSQVGIKPFSEDSDFHCKFCGGQIAREEDVEAYKRILLSIHWKNCDLFKKCITAQGKCCICMESMVKDAKSVESHFEENHPEKCLKICQFPPKKFQHNW